MFRSGSEHGGQVALRAGQVQGHLVLNPALDLEVDAGRLGQGNVSTGGNGAQACVVVGIEVRGNAVATSLAPNSCTSSYVEVVLLSEAVMR